MLGRLGQKRVRLISVLAAAAVLTVAPAGEGWGVGAPAAAAKPAVGARLTQLYRQLSRARIAAMRAAAALKRKASKARNAAQARRELGQILRGVQQAFRIVYAIRRHVAAAMRSLSPAGAARAEAVLSANPAATTPLTGAGAAELGPLHRALESLADAGGRYLGAALALGGRLASLAPLKKRFETAVDAAGHGLDGTAKAFFGRPVPWTAAVARAAAAKAAATKAAAAKAAAAKAAAAKAAAAKAVAAKAVAAKARAAAAARAKARAAKAVAAKAVAAKARAAAAARAKAAAAKARAAAAARAKAAAAKARAAAAARAKAAAAKARAAAAKAAAAKARAAAAARAKAAAAKAAAKAGAPPGGIRVLSATYGRNCGKRTGNVTSHLARSCNGKASCAYRVDYHLIGDPAPGCAKDFIAVWRCATDRAPRTTAAPKEASGRTLSLACGRGALAATATKAAPPFSRVPVKKKASGLLGAAKKTYFKVIGKARKGLASLVNKVKSRLPAGIRKRIPASLLAKLPGAHPQPAASKKPVGDICWKASYGRGVGLPISVCDAKDDKNGALCYPKCKAGYNGVGPVCWKRCKPGFTDDGAFCRKNAHIFARPSYGRGAGVPLSSCGPGQERQGALCYPRCRAGFRGVGPVCWQACPPGFPDHGAFCGKPGPYGRGGGYAIWDGGKCNRDHRQGCEKWGLMWYPKCRPGFHPAGCCICSPNCPASMRDIGVSCAKQSYGRGGGSPLRCAANQEQNGALCYPRCRAGFRGVGPVCWGGCPGGYKTDPATCRKDVIIYAKHSYGRGAGTPLKCAKGLEYQAGLCYKPCKKGFHGVGPVCWGNCNKEYPNDCGAACSVDSKACAIGILKMIAAPFQVVANVATTVVTGGAAAAGKIGVQAAIAAGKAVAKALAKKAAKKLASAVAKKVAGHLMAREQSDAKFNALEFVKSLDPTGIADVVDAFNKPICKVR